MIGRRKILQWILTGGAVTLTGMVAYPILRFILPPERHEPAPSRVKAATTDELATNSGKIFPIGTEPGIVIRTPDGDYRAFTAICTHLDCTVQYRSDLKHIWCACHNGHYDLHGKNIAGPPPRPLEPYVVDIRDDVIYVSRSRTDGI